jgi:hypothetical protein
MAMRILMTWICHLERGIPGGIRKLFFTLPPSTYKREVMEKIIS